MNSGKIVAGRDGTGGRVDIEGSTRGPRGPKNRGSKVKVEVELNNMSVFDYHPTNGRQFLATKMRVKVK